MEKRIFHGLNEKQTEAVKAVAGPVLVISGPGSGKTRCLTHRIAYLIHSGIKPENILAVTFTNKAAAEMKERVQKLLASSGPAESRFKAAPQIGTFHSICVRILRREAQSVGYGTNFTIADSDDQLSLVKKLMADLELDPKRFNPRGVLNKISELKTDLIFPDSYKGEDFYTKIVASIYSKYQAALKQANILDFDDLIVQTVMLFKNNPKILEKYQSFWKYILVDEYQDTSHDQYSLIKLLAQKEKNLFCIGDDAQSIYQFRKADIRNILNFQKDYPEAVVIMLEQNYRSTKNIITAAQKIISNNTAQITKNLWTDNDGGEKITAIEALNEREEAIRVIGKMEELMKNGYQPEDFSILYRTHAQSRSIEEALIMKGFPYQIVGGIKFYERKEIKDLLSYLKLIANPSDLISLERIANVPTRGIGKTTLDKITGHSDSHVVIATKHVFDNEKLPAKTAKGVIELHSLLADLIEAKKKMKLSQLVKYVVSACDYESYLKELSMSKTGDFENFEDRLENINELLTVAKKYDAEEGGLEKFLEEVALIQEADRTKKSTSEQSRTTLMTIHASKGLEFPVVFVIGMEEGLFPHSRTLINPSELEEERRLCYVAITRAKEHLILTFARYRNIYGSTENNLPSRFISEIPQQLVDYRLFDADDQDYEEKIYY